MRRRLRDGEAVVKRAKSVTLDSTYIARLAGEKRESVTTQPEEGVRFYESKRAKKTEERSERRPEIDVGTERGWERSDAYACYWRRRRSTWSGGRCDGTCWRGSLGDGRVW